MVGPLRPQPEARPIIQPRPPALGLLGSHLQPFGPPDALHPLVIAPSSLPPQQGRDPAVAIPPKALGDVRDVGCQHRIVASPGRSGLRCTERCCPSTRQASRCETPSLPVTCSTQPRRRAALTSFPTRLPSAPASRASGPPQLCAACRSPAPAASGASPDPASDRHTRPVSGSRSALLSRACAAPQPPSCPAPPAPPPSAAWPRSPLACDASSPFQLERPPFRPDRWCNPEGLG